MVRIGPRSRPLKWTEPVGRCFDTGVDQGRPVVPQRERMWVLCVRGEGAVTSTLHFSFSLLSRTTLLSPLPRLTLRIVQDRPLFEKGVGGTVWVKTLSRNMSSLPIRGSGWKGSDLHPVSVLRQEGCMTHVCTDTDPTSPLFPHIIRVSLINSKKELGPRGPPHLHHGSSNRPRRREGSLSLTRDPMLLPLPPLTNDTTEEVSGPRESHWGSLWVSVIDVFISQIKDRFSLGSHNPPSPLDLWTRSKPRQVRDSLWYNITPSCPNRRQTPVPFLSLTTTLKTQRSSSSLVELSVGRLSVFVSTTVWVRILIFVCNDPGFSWTTRVPGPLCDNPFRLQRLSWGPEVGPVRFNLLRVLRRKIKK